MQKRGIFVLAARKQVFFLRTSSTLFFFAICLRLVYARVFSPQFDMKTKCRTYNALQAIGSLTSTSKEGSIGEYTRNAVPRVVAQSAMLIKERKSKLASLL